MRLILLPIFIFKWEKQGILSVRYITVWVLQMRNLNFLRWRLGCKKFISNGPWNWYLWKGGERSKIRGEGPALMQSESLSRLYRNSGTKIDLSKLSQVGLKLKWFQVYSPVLNTCSLQEECDLGRNKSQLKQSLKDWQLQAFGQQHCQ